MDGQASGLPFMTQGAASNKLDLDLFEESGSTLRPRPTHSITGYSVGEETVGDTTKCIICHYCLSRHGYYC